MIFVGTIVENTSIGLNRNLSFLKEVALNTGVDVVAGTGYYVSAVQNQNTLEMTKEQMYDKMLADLTTGDSDIKCGFIGEVGSSWPIHGMKDLFLIFLLFYIKYL